MPEPQSQSSKGANTDAIETNNVVTSSPSTISAGIPIQHHSFNAGYGNLCVVQGWGFEEDLEVYDGTWGWNRTFRRSGIFRFDDLPLELKHHIFSFILASFYRQGRGSQIRFVFAPFPKAFSRGGDSEVPEYSLVATRANFKVGGLESFSLNRHMLELSHLSTKFRREFIQFFFSNVHLTVDDRHMSKLGSLMAERPKFASRLRSLSIIFKELGDRGTILGLKKNLELILAECHNLERFEFTLLLDLEKIRKTRNPEETWPWIPTMRNLKVSKEFNLKLLLGLKVYLDTSYSEEDEETRRLGRVNQLHMCTRIRDYLLPFTLRSPGAMDVKSVETHTLHSIILKQEYKNGNTILLGALQPSPKASGWTPYIDEGEPSVIV